MNFVNDSAPLHMASAMNANVTAIFCSTVPDFGFGPLSDHAKVVETSVRLSCRPCGLHGYDACPKGHFKCALTIKAEDLKIRHLPNYWLKSQKPAKKSKRKYTKRETAETLVINAPQKTRKKNTRKTANKISPEKEIKTDNNSEKDNLPSTE
jgi:hypothetical protein